MDIGIMIKGLPVRIEHLEERFRIYENRVYWDIAFLRFNLAKASKMQGFSTMETFLSNWKIAYAY